FYCHGRRWLRLSAAGLETSPGLQRHLHKQRHPHKILSTNFFTRRPRLLTGSTSPSAIPTEKARTRTKLRGKHTTAGASPRDSPKNTAWGFTPAKIGTAMGAATPTSARMYSPWPTAA